MSSAMSVCECWCLTLLRGDHKPQSIVCLQKVKIEFCQGAVVEYGEKSFLKCHRDRWFACSMTYGKQG